MKAFHLTTTLRIMNPILARLIGLGLPMGPMALLTVSGRKTGLPRSTPVALTALPTGWRLVAAYGRVDWVKNLEKSGHATVTLRGRALEVDSQVLSPAEAAPILRQSLATAGPITRRVVGPYFDTSPEAPMGSWETEATRHPVFVLIPAHRDHPGIHLNEQ